MIRIWLGHGASGSAETMLPWVEGLRALGFDALPLQLPRRRAEDAVAALEAQVPDEPGTVVGGHSYGGRVASLAVAGVRAPSAPAREHPYRALVCLSYPLHRPGAPETAAARTAHWPRIGMPALLLSGTSDPFARIDLLEASMPQLPHGELVTYPRLGHNLRPALDDVLATMAAFLRTLESGSAGE
jgi:predicted alpha/beta-hydrolase family hydrolase